MNTNDTKPNSIRSKHCSSALSVRTELSYLKAEFKKDLAKQSSSKRLKKYWFSQLLQPHTKDKLYVSMYYEEEKKLYAVTSVDRTYFKLDEPDDDYQRGKFKKSWYSLRNLPFMLKNYNWLEESRLLDSYLALVDFNKKQVLQKAVLQQNSL
jgi:TfoX/Sxy family transcriptional regulator of competence genes